jgi:hypothetical protein
MTYLYWFTHSREAMAKVGKSEHPSERLRALSAKNFDLTRCYCYKIPPEFSFDVENAMHVTLAMWRLAPEYAQSKGVAVGGSTEWFQLEALDMFLQQIKCFGLTPAQDALLTPSRKPTALVQFNVRLTPEARKRLHHAAHNAHISDQEFIERWAATLPEPPAPSR